MNTNNTIKCTKKQGQFNHNRLSVMCLSVLLGGVISASVQASTVYYTLDAQFDTGSLLNVNHTAPNNNQLQLNKAVTPLPFVNIANSGRGTAVRIDVNTGVVLGEYYTAPNGMGRNPSRTTVDQKGNFWVSNRDEAGISGGQSKGSVARIGVIIGGTRSDVDGTVNPAGQYVKPPFQYSTCLDRDGDGLIKTSFGLGNLLPWTNAGSADTHGGVSTAADECVINYTRVTGAGTRTVAVDANNDVWTGGINDMDHEKISGLTGLPIPGTQFNLGCGGYGGLVDKNGVLWSARIGNGLLRYDTTTLTGACLGNGMGDYGLGVDPVTGDIWHTYLTGYQVCKIKSTGLLVGCYNHVHYYAQGVAVDSKGNVWVASSLYDTYLDHLRTDGTYVGSINLASSGGSGPTGVSVDSNGKVWVANYYSSNAMRIDPDAGTLGGGGFKVGAVDMTVALGAGAYPYNYSDMTGFVAIGSTSPQGTWTVTNDSGISGNAWSNIRWNQEPQGSEPPTSSITVEARAADTESALASKVFTPVSNGGALSLIGRYIQVQAILKPANNGTSPILSDLNISSGVVRCDVDGDNDIDKFDTNAILRVRGTTASGSSDPRDANGDGKITTLDAKLCIQQCTNLRCAPSQPT